DGNTCSTQEETLQRWKEHYENALTCPEATPSPDLDALATDAISDSKTCVDVPMLEEVCSAIKKLQNGHAAGPDRITPELLQCAIEPTSAALHQLFVWVWTTGKEGIIISLYKGKGSHTECSSFRPITLLSVPGKVFSHVLLALLQPLLTKHRHPEQSDFAAGRSTMDAIFALCLLSEIHREFNCPLIAAYVELKAAFDSIDRNALWKALRGIGIPDTLLRLIQDLHNGSGGNHKSERFYTRSGVRQGCVLAPALFCRAMDWILKRITANIGITISQTLFSDLDYADDVILLGLDANNLKDVLKSFQRNAATLGLQVSWAKTKIQSIGANAVIQGIQVNGQTV
uniref:Reverse transcriptase domain-containing protein n=1 Tax=Latimeria chalumnae TaxID=7897 RepID=H3ABK0_LATCH